MGVVSNQLHTSCDVLAGLNELGTTVFFFLQSFSAPAVVINKLFFCFGYALDKAECHDLMLKVMSESTIEISNSEYDLIVEACMQTKETTTFEELRAYIIGDKEMCSDGPG